MKTKKPSLETTCVHAGVTPDPIYGAVMTPIYQTSTYAQEEPGHPKFWDYARGGNPTRLALETSLASLEGANHAFSFASGLTAVQAVVQLLEPGSHVLVSEDGYGGTNRLFRNLYERYGIHFEFIDFRGVDFVRSKITAKTKMLWFESPTNPLLRIADIQKIASLAKENGVISVVDNTFATPIFQRPLEFGADIVMHSLTKYIAGHSDLIGGALMLNDETLAQKLNFIQYATGGIPSPFEAFLILRSIKTLSVRMNQHARNALEFAQAIEAMSEFEAVFYPGLKSHPQHDLAKKQMSGFSGVVSARLRADSKKRNEFFKRLKIFTLAESLGGVESLVNHPLTMTHASVPPELQVKLGITEDLLRFSIGIENVSDLIEDMRQALK